MSKAINQSTVRIVKKVLEQKPLARDNDRYIQSIIWNIEADMLGLTTVKEFINAYYGGKLTDPNAVSRVRRKLQELHEDLQGKNYKSRQEEYQEDAKESIKKIK